MVAADSAIYRDLMRFKPEGWTANAWAVHAGVSRTVWSDMRRHGNPSRRTLERLLTAAGSSLAEFEALRIGDPARRSLARAGPLVGDSAAKGWGAAPVLPLPLIASASAGNWGQTADGIEMTELRFGEILDNVLRPASLANDAGAYALTIVGNSMWPRFRSGRRIAVSPKAPVRIGDDVVVSVGGKPPTGQTAVLIKELVRQTEAYVELRQFNPDKSFRVSAAEFKAVHKVAGELF